MSKKDEKVFKEKPIPEIGHPTGILCLIDEKNLIDVEKGLDEKGLYEYEFSCNDGNAYRIKGSKPILVRVRGHFVRAD